ncbi:MAG: hypothetical protein ETSY1_17135 [Candidatus Entotheonella factor]|uniref:Uncharacterized protein n=1 Tax=Entotheonella factor TaxID=1429438 RepID=W4LLK4_ENTF1|nr:right-handed parallel beta-helix repeat-containing protein [Candidatus Entotheonella palauensis]ETW98847.1 MAG: hypothetical protein ETSY1_17135 [Candidatus Entotheonella factor]
MYFNFFIVCCLLLSSSVFAATRYVDQDHPRCSDNSNGKQPYCSLTAAFRDLRTGDTVRIRASQHPYRVSVASAQPGPITIEADGQHPPVLIPDTSDTMISLTDVSHWTIRNLTFDGQGKEVRYAIFINARSRHVHHINIQHNRFVNLGGFAGTFKKPMAIRLTNSKWKKSKPNQNNYYVTDSTIADNIFDNCAHGGVLLSHTKKVTVANNDMTHFRCGRYNDGRVGVQAIKVGLSSLDTVIRGNRVGAFQPSSACPLQPGKHPKTGKLARPVYVGIYCDVGSVKGLVADNVVFDIDAGRSRPAPNRNGSSAGIFIESRCTDWNVTNNLIYNIGTYGFRNGSKSTGSADRTKFTNNTVYGVAGHAISIQKGENLVIKHNILSNYAGVAIEFRNFAKCRQSGRTCKITRETRAFHQSNHEIDHNLFWQGRASGPIAIWFNRKTKLDLTGWQQATHGYGGQSIYTNPEFIDVKNGHFALRNGSAANRKTAGAVFGYRAPGSK